jgi:hypothetical protein
MLLALFPSLSEKECIALWCCCAALWLFWVLSDRKGGKSKDLTTSSLQELRVPKVVFAREVIR